MYYSSLWNAYKYIRDTTGCKYRVFRKDEIIPGGTFYKRENEDVRVLWVYF